MISATVDRVQVNTDEEVNQAIRRRTEKSIERASAGGPAAIERRLAELDLEWDIERYLETMAPTFTLVGLTLGLTRNRAWFILPLVVQTFFLQHALQGWCPPLPVLRQMGVRTCGEIEAERYALKAIRGDFRNVVSGLANDAQSACEAVRR